MAFWDDLIRNIFGGGEKQAAPKSSPSPAKAEARPRQNYQHAQRTQPARQQQPVQQPVQQQFSGGGGGGGGTRGMSRAAAPIRQEQEPSPLDQMVNTSRNVREDFGKGWEDFWGGVGQALNGPVDKRPTPAPGDAPTPHEAWLQGGAPSPFGGVSTVAPEQADEIIRKTDRDQYMESLGSQSLGGTSRQISPEEWATYSPEKQQGIIANYALYQAVQADRALEQNVADVDEEESAGYLDLVESIFGTEGGSDTYAPNTIRVLEQLGYEDTTVGDLDLFLNGGAISTSADLSYGKNEARASVFEQLSKAPAFTENEDYRAQLDKGAAILEALRDSGTFSTEVATLGGVPLTAAEQIPEERRASLDYILKGMADQGVWDTITNDAARNEEFTQILNEATTGLDPTIVSNYFKEQYGTLQGAMPFEQFSQYWLKG
jgi:hypothetical protein